MAELADRERRIIMHSISGDFWTWFSKFNAEDLTGLIAVVLVFAVAAVAVAWRAGHLVGAGVLCILVTFIVLLQRVSVF